MKKGKRAGSSPIKVDLNPTGNYYWCSCGMSRNQPFCDGSHSSTDFTPKSFKVDKEDSYFLCTCKQTENAPYCDGSHNR